jgi:Domain of unknown function (DUF5916)
MTKFLLLLLPFVAVNFAKAQALLPKVLKVSKIEEILKIDGILDEKAWQTTNIASSFIQFEPKPDIPARFDTEVKIMYDNQAIYIGALLRDPHPDSILKEFTARDTRNGNHELFSVLFDTYRDGNNGQMFRVTGAGVQVDSRYLNGNKEDASWNVVWESEVKITAEGWVVEMKIPYAALRFANVEEQIWHVNFFRSIRRFRQESAWNSINPTNANIVQQSGILTGIENIKPPLRLSATPYTAALLEKQSGNPQVQNFSAGMDIKYGINDAFTLDMTLIPDFGQVQFDNQVLNLSPFEVRFDENRPFFTEGTELFSKNNLFYSRRIGDKNFYTKSQINSQLLPTEHLDRYNTKPQLLNATKVTGRAANGLGIGFFNAIENQSFAQVLDNQNIETRQILTNPLTNYNAIVIDKNLKNSSYITLVNTNVQREGAALDANVTGAEMYFRNKKNQYFVALGGAYNRRRFVDSLDTGHKLHFDFGKLQGNWQWSARYVEESTNFNPNDLGFLFAPNERTISNTIQWGKYTPFGKFNRFSVSLNTEYGRLYAPNAFSGLYINANTFWQTRKIFSFGFNLSTSPVKGRDYFILQTYDFKNYFQTPEYLRAGWFISSDYRRPWAWDVGMTAGTSTIQQPYFNYYFSPRCRLNNRLSITLRNQTTWAWNDYGRITSNSQSDNYIPAEVLLGSRNRVTVENLLTLKYSVSAKSGFILRAREYWTSVKYSNFATVANNGALRRANYSGADKITNESLHDLTYNLFNLDLVYTWRFAPGSDIFITYKNNIVGANNTIEQRYFDDVAQLGRLPQTNSISFKLIYYIDYQNIRKRTTKNKQS